LIDGAIFSPKDISIARLRDTLADMQAQHPTAERLFDPQVYASFVATQPDSRTGCLIEEYGQPTYYFNPRRRSHFESEANVREQLKKALEFQRMLPFTGIIAPNIYIPQSCNSIEAAIAKHFLRHTKGVAREIGEERPVYATLALSRDSLLNLGDFIEFLSDITAMDDPPDGFYLLIGSTTADARSELFSTDVFAAWLLLVHTLSANGLRVVNGYSDLATPFLGIAGADAGAAGWWSNLRAFSLERFSPQVGRGGSLPIVRYLSNPLLGRITHFELAQLRTVIPAILNGLPTDAYYPENDEPQRRDEVLQTWDALRELARTLVTGDVHTGLDRAHAALRSATALHAQARLTGIRMETKSDDSHLEPIGRALQRFVQLAELG
jgi:hypothetical protein